jgi:ATP-dependent DNA helicase DinG
MTLQEQVAQAFSNDGLLAKTVQDFRPRAGQTEMAAAVAQTIEDTGVLVVEAGTGVGKTYSYLVPALLSGQRVLISTATKTLQDQLFGRDLPKLVHAIGLPVRVALLKGRSSYLCLQRLELARQSQRGPVLEDAVILSSIERWAQVTQSGDLAELTGLDERSSVIPLVTSTRDNCLGSACPKFKPCHVHSARREALAADLVVVNHHLFFADMAVRETGMAELIPAMDCLIFDEAHQINETGVQFLGNQLGTSQIIDLSRDLLACGMTQARGLQDWHAACASLERSARDMRLLFGRSPSAGRLPWTEPTPGSISNVKWTESVKELQTALLGAIDMLATVSELSPDFVRLHERGLAILKSLVSFFEPCAVDCVRWIELTNQLMLIESPLDISLAMKQHVLESVISGESRKSWIFTSATLGDDDRLSWFTEPCGLSSARVLKVQSPFDYAGQAALYVPTDMVKPADPAHSLAVADFVVQHASTIGGKTLVLTTTLKALRTISAALQQHFGLTGELEILVQGEMSKRELMARFQNGHEQGLKGCILLASASFWEGIDLPGDALQLLVIDKLPFPPPADPLVHARSKRVEDLGNNSFKDYFLPEAAVALKQGAGRLIRRETDRGLLVVCDVRLTQMGYGRRLMASLPPMKRLTNKDELITALKALTTASTRDLSCL